MGFSEDVLGGGWAELVVLDEPSSSPLHGSVGLPAAASLSAAGALAVVECAERVIGWASAAKLEALARLGAALAEEPGPRRDCQPVRLGGAEAHALAVAEAAAATAVSEAAAARLLKSLSSLLCKGRGHR
jgi:hypothetical protein